MKKIIARLILGCLLLTAGACTKDADETAAGDGAVSFRIETQSGGTRTEYNPTERILIRIYKADGALIRRYTSLDAMPRYLYLVAGDYRITVEAGDGSTATRTNKSYRGEKAFTIRANEEVTEEVICRPINIGAEVSFDETVTARFDKYAYAYVSASQSFSLEDISEVPTLRFDPQAEPDTGYFLLPEGVTNLSWAFYGESSVTGIGKLQGVIENVQPATTYRMKFRFSKTPDGALSLTVLVEELPNERYDNIIFSPQPTIAGDGFQLSETVGLRDTDIRFKVTSVKELATVSMTVNGTSYDLFDTDFTPTLPAGVEYAATDANNGIVTIKPAFFADSEAGLHDLSFFLTDTDNGEGTGMATIAVPGLLPVAAQDFDLWANTATFRAVVTDPDVTAVNFAYRTAEGAWKQLEGRAGDDFTWEATATPEWTNGTNTQHATYRPDPAAGVFAGRTYEYKVTIDGTERTRTFATGGTQTITNGDMEDGNMTCFTQQNSSAPFWASGNNSFASKLCTQSTFLGAQGAHCAKMAATSAAGVLAAGNLLSGIFYKDGLTKGVVEFGQPYDWTARPTALHLKYYAEKIGIVDVNMHEGAPIGAGHQDVARIFVAIVDWNSRHKVTSGTAAPTGTWEPLNGPDAAQEGKVIAYGSIFLDAASTGDRMIDLELPLEYYDRTTRPAGAYTLVISCATSAYGDFMVGCKSNVIYVDDFSWVY